MLPRRSDGPPTPTLSFDPAHPTDAGELHPEARAAPEVPPDEADTQPIPDALVALFGVSD